MDSGKINELTAISSKIGVSEYRMDLLDEYVYFFRKNFEEEFENYDLKHKARLGIKPGLTGMWQVSGRSDIKDFEEVVGLDTYYIAHWDLGLDIKILLKTIKVVVTGRGSE